MTKRKILNLGHLVKLKSGGTEMVIERGGLVGGRLVFVCVWMADGMTRRGTFYAETLEHVL
ncbi:DUF2158 domain-containing protein [Nitrobacter hamburgensis]|uniref:DUF2158 domain-containing protein n=1 Tax=Nitrobacter hamburgensis TaxID=912 RepID=UPI0002DA9138|nr:DUF2158 domain-containing protein [Nitrobacter hamburgensis]